MVFTKSHETLCSYTQNCRFAEVFVSLAVEALFVKLVSVHLYAKI